MSACASACTTSLNWTTPIYSQETELHTPKVWWWFWQTWLWRRLSHSLTHSHNASNRMLYFNCLIAEYWSLITTEPFHLDFYFSLWSGVSISAIILFNCHSFLNVNIADELKKMLLTRACQKFSRSPWHPDRAAVACRSECDGEGLYYLPSWRTYCCRPRICCS